MTQIQTFTPGGYRYLPSAGIAFSDGVATLDGFAIERVVFSRVVPLLDGFARIKAHLQAIGRPLTALCGCELRSPEPFDDAGFAAFNQTYVDTLKAWDIVSDAGNPTVRSNVCPIIEPPHEPGIFAFTYTVPATSLSGCFVMPGVSEETGQSTVPAENLVAYRDISPAGMQAKAKWVLDKVETDMGRLGFTWADTTGCELYTVHDPFPYIRQELGMRGVMRHGLNWHLARPPVVDNEFEFDCRRVVREHRLDIR